MGTKQDGFKSDILNMQSQTIAILLASLGGAGMVLNPKTFKSGRVGFSGNGTATLRCGKGTYKFSCSINCTAVDSAKVPLSPEAKAAVLDSKPLTLKELGLDKATASPREFESGKVGFYHGDKTRLQLGDHGIRLQVGCPVVAWHSDTWRGERPAKPAKQQESEKKGENKEVSAS